MAAQVSDGLWIEWVLSVLDQLPGPMILELGHGPGHLQIALNQKRTTAFGLDASPQMIGMASKRLHKKGFPIRLSLGRAQELPYRANTFTQVVATFPSEFIFAPQTLSEIFRVLTPDGYAVVLIQAEITGKRLQQRFAAWLLRFTGQTLDWEKVWGKAFIIPFEKAGFIVSPQTIILANSIVRVLIAKKAGRTTLAT